jgi:hypothetical protein
MRAGSVRGYDELVPKTIDIVKERRPYTADPKGRGITFVKKYLNELHSKLAREGFTEIHVHQVRIRLQIHDVRKRNRIQINATQIHTEERERENCSEERVAVVCMGLIT